MGKFAKVIDLDGEQVLVKYEYNSHEDTYDVQVITMVNGVLAQITAGFENEKDATDMLERYSLEEALEFRGEMIELLTGTDEN